MTEDDVEEFHFLSWGFDIAQLRGLLQRTSTPPDEITVPVAAAARLLESDPSITSPASRTVPLFGVDVQWDHVDGLHHDALNAPLFVAPMGHVGQLIIDGWHRLALARRLGVEGLPALLLTRRQTSRVLLSWSAPLPPDRKA